MHTDVKMFEHLGNIVFKHLNSSLDLLHAKSNIFNTNLKQFVEVQSQQSTLVFNPNGKTIVRSIRGVANTCASFVEKNNYNPKTILVHFWSGDLPNSVKKEDFTDLLEICYKSLESAEIHLFPIIYWKDYNNNVVEKFWKLLNIFPKYKWLMNFSLVISCFFDQVYINMKRGLPAIVKHLRITLSIVNPSKRQSPQVSPVNQKTPTTWPTPYYRNSTTAPNLAPFRGSPVPLPWISQ